MVGTLWEVSMGQAWRVAYVTFHLPLARTQSYGPTAGRLGNVAQLHAQEVEEMDLDEHTVISATCDC